MLEFPTIRGWQSWIQGVMLPYVKTSSSLMSRGTVRTNRLMRTRVCGQMHECGRQRRIQEERESSIPLLVNITLFQETSPSPLHRSTIARRNLNTKFPPCPVVCIFSSTCPSVGPNLPIPKFLRWILGPAEEQQKALSVSHIYSWLPPHGPPARLP